jgi:dCTP deaminase
MNRQGSDNMDLSKPDECFKVELNKNEHTIHPGERILGHSREFAGGSGQSFFDPSSSEPQAITSYLQATSTAARIGLTACLCAGWGDVGYFNRWTLEIFNLSPYVIRIPVGAVISQICFESVIAPDQYYGKDAGNYQQSLDINKIKQDWDPLKHMLPKKLKVYE